MSVVGEFTVPAEAFALGESLDVDPSLTVEFDRLVAHSRDWIMPFLWVSAPEDAFEPFEEALAGDPSVEAFEATDAFPGARLYKMTWCREVARVVDLVLDHEGAILEATGQSGEWRLRVRFGDRERLGQFHAHFKNSGDVALHQLFSPSEPHSGTFNLTPKQRDALLAAYDAGYFETPRGATATELAEGFGISQQAFSQRLDRGIDRLVEDALVTGDPEGGT
ncbi:helix-turn-helix domain-containing protein [Halosimplex aquaticum]|uniref:Helix-turn-helix domain-containing protein n=1 Tax=Halosimplex aquaticum TaxID=3026162 RepID=A0ABD5Y1T9_9EURY|nr:helix-turn-helix domain-containing protein [Halosimplex aquaticum]